MYRRRDEAVPVAGVSFSISSNIFPWLLALIQRRSGVDDLSSEILLNFSDGFSERFGIVSFEMTRIEMNPVC